MAIKDEKLENFGEWAFGEKCRELDHSPKFKEHSFERKNSRMA